MVLNDCKKRHTNLGMVWIDCKKDYDMIPHFWILESLKVVQMSENIVQFIRKSMKNGNTKLTSRGEYLTKIDIRRGIFQGDSLSQLLFVICMYDTSESDIKKTKIRIYLEKSKKVEPPIVYG